MQLICSKCNSKNFINRYTANNDVNCIAYSNECFQCNYIFPVQQGTSMTNEIHDPSDKELINKLMFEIRRIEYAIEGIEDRIRTLKSVISDASIHLFKNDGVSIRQPEGIRIIDFKKLNTGQCINYLLEARDTILAAKNKLIEEVG